MQGLYRNYWRAWCDNEPRTRYQSNLPSPLRELRPRKPLEGKFSQQELNVLQEALEHVSRGEFSEANDVIKKHRGD